MKITFDLMKSFYENILIFFMFRVKLQIRKIITELYTDFLDYSRFSYRNDFPSLFDVIEINQNVNNAESRQSSFNSRNSIFK